MKMSVWNTCVWYLIGWEYIRDTRVEVKNSELFWLATESLNKKKKCYLQRCLY